MIPSTGFTVSAPTLPRALLLFRILTFTPGVGPGLGAIIAVVFYKFIKILQYEVANPGQDEASDELAEKAAASPKKDEKDLKEQV